mgnify:FL=1
MWTRVSRFIIRYKFLLVFSVIISTFFMFNQAKKVLFSYEFIPLLPDDSEVYVEYQNFINTFGQDGNVMCVGFKSDSLFTLSNYNSLIDLCDNLDKIYGVDKVLSVIQFENLIKNEKKLKFDLLPVNKEKVYNITKLDSIQNIVRSLPFYKKLFFNKDGNSYFIALTLDKDLLDTESRVKFIKEIEKNVSIFANKINVTPHYSGLPYIRTITTLKTKKEVQFFIILAFFTTALIMFLFFRSYSAVFFSMIVVGIGVIWAIGTIHLLGFKITFLTALIPPLIIVIGIPNCVFLLNKYHLECKLHGNKIKAISRTIQKVGNATFMTNATTAAGFSTFIITRTDLLVQFGIVASINILVVFFISLIIIPSVYIILPIPKDKHLHHLKRKWINNFTDWLEYSVINKRKHIFVITISMIVFAIIGITKIETTGNIVDDIPKNDPISIDLKFFEDNFVGVMPFEIMINTNKNNGITKSSTLKRIQKLEDILSEYPEISSTTSILDLAKFTKQAFYNGNPKFYSLPSSQEKNFIMKYARNSDNESNDIFNRFADSTLSIARMSGRMKDIGTKQMKTLRDEIIPKINEIFDPKKFKVSVTGTSLLFLEGTDYLVRNLFSSLFLAIALIAVLMAWMFSSSRMVLVSLIPNLIPLIFTASLMGYFGISIKPSTVLVFSIAFGISIDDTIHFLAKYRQELKANNWNIKKAISIAIKETGVSMFYTSIVLFFGFLIFVASDFGGTIALGFLVSVTLLFAMLTNLLLLPSLLLSLEKKVTKKKSEDQLIQILDDDDLKYSK